MLAKLRTFSLLGIEAVPVEVEVDVSPAAMSKSILNEHVRRHDAIDSAASREAEMLRDIDA